MRHSLTLFGLATIATTACLTAGSRRAGDGDHAASSGVIGGVDARSKTLDAVGSLGIDLRGAYQYFCTATLIAPNAVLTARHCVIDIESKTPYTDYGKVYFAVGADAAAPTEKIEVLAGNVAPYDQGGFATLGMDLGVYLLKTPVTSAKPMRFATGPLTSTALGTKFIAIGYGDQDERPDGAATSGTRMAGTVSLRAVRGRPLEAVFGSPDAFFAWIVKTDGQAFLDANKADYQTMYDYSLIEDEEAWLGQADGDVQVCHGDSGGPLLAREGDENVVVGVASAVLPTGKLPCAAGADYMTFSARAASWVQAASIDPCDGVSIAGSCTGTVAVRCTTPEEGPRRVTRVDCASLGQACRNDATTGKAACVDP